MKPPGGSPRAWAQVSVATGFLALACYACSIVFKPFPWTVGRLLFFAFGPLSVVSVVGFFKATREKVRGILHSLGALFLIVAGVIVNLMAVVQDTQFTVLGRQIDQAGDEATRGLVERILWGSTWCSPGWTFPGTFSSPSERSSSPSA